jgi:hypothetical protein
MIANKLAKRQLEMCLTQSHAPQDISRGNARFLLVQALVFSLFVTLVSPLIAQQPAPAGSPQKSSPTADWWTKPGIR